MKYKLSVITRRGITKENEPKPMDFFDFEVGLAIAMLKMRQIKKLLIEVS